MILRNDFFHILQQESSAGSVQVKIALNENHPIFKGHFPDRPLVPGVCMVQIILEILEVVMGKPLGLAAADSIKFLSIINPAVNKEVDGTISYTSEGEGISVKANLYAGPVIFFKLIATLKYLKPSGDSAALFRENKVAVLIPTFNNEETVAKVLTSVLEYTDDIIVVNDGSTDSTAELLKKFPQIKLVSYSPNKGKGYALRQGFRRALESGYDYVISIDSDGQHFAEDLPKFLVALKDHPAAIIMGVRDMRQAGIPGKSSFGHKFSNFWFWVETGIRMNDTQSGYRLYPVKLLQTTTFFTRKFEFEIEVMVRSVWKGIEMAEVPVSVYYAPKEVRVSHFRPYMDFTRITILNIALVIIGVLYIKPRDILWGKKSRKFWSSLKEQLFHPTESEHHKALSLGFGVFMGIVPVWGFQLILAIALAFAFRLNKVLVILGANISIPPFIPLILFLSHLTGALWMSERAVYISFNDPVTLDLVLNNSVQYVLGALTLALAAGIIFGTLTYLGLRLFKLPKS